MPKNIDDDFDALDIDELPEDFENIEIRQILANNQIAARQRLEQLMENRELDRLINGGLDYWD
jgi:hypothetical protein